MIAPRASVPAGEGRIDDPWAELEGVDDGTMMTSV